MRRLSVFLFVLLAYISPAHATIFPKFGGSGDAQFMDTCPDQPSHHYMIGFKVRLGDWMDQIQIECAPFLAGPPTSIGGKIFLTPRGGMGGGVQEQYCLRDEVITAVQFQWTDRQDKVYSINFACSNIHTWSRHDLLLTGTGIPSLIKRPWYTCPYGEVATGLQGNYGKHVNALGLICGPW